MAENREFTHAMFAEKLLNRTALGVFVVAFAFILDIAATYMDGALERIVDIASYALSLLVIVIILPVFLTYVRHFRRHRDPVDSFVLQTYQTACVRAFEATFISLIFLDLIVSKFFPEILAQVVVEGVIAFCLLVMSITFFILNRRANRDDEDDDFGADGFEEGEA